MLHTEKNYTGAKGLSIFYQSWIPDSPRAVVQVSHGFAEHGGRYLNVVNRLIPDGIAVYASDHCGHGRSEGQRNHVDTFDHFVDDLRNLSGIIAKEHPGIPLFMLGHSMGSTVALRYAARYETRLRGLILSGSGLRVGGTTHPILRAMTVLLSKTMPRVMVAPKDLSMVLSHDPAIAESYAADRYGYSAKVSVRLAAETLRAFAENETIAGSLTLPLLFQAGSEDKLVLDAGILAEKFTMQDKTIKIYPGLYHEVYNESEPEREKVLSDLAEWITARI